jgi:hypothetical protein
VKDIIKMEDAPGIIMNDKQYDASRVKLFRNKAQGWGAAGVGIECVRGASGVRQECVRSASALQPICGHLWQVLAICGHLWQVLASCGMFWHLPLGGYRMFVGR